MRGRWRFGDSHQGFEGERFIDGYQAWHQGQGYPSDRRPRGGRLQNRRQQHRAQDLLPEEGVTLFAA